MQCHGAPLNLDSIFLNFGFALWLPLGTLLRGLYVHFAVGGMHLFVVQVLCVVLTVLLDDLQILLQKCQFDFQFQASE